MKTEKFNKILNYIMAAILITLWGCILFIHGVTGSIAWAVTKLYFAPIGIILLLISVVILIISLIKKKKLLKNNFINIIYISCTTYTYAL
ncbi:hypothetical protein EXQ39_07275 [Clostridium botulinum]|nr:hypothetical protein [Clostridium botulinum]